VKGECTKSATATEAAITISLTDLENLIRRVVREAVREELACVAPSPAPSILDDWSHEGPDDPAGDEELLNEALAMLEEYGDKPETWTDRCSSCECDGRSR
jgi:hypothetical protein